MLRCRTFQNARLPEVNCAFSKTCALPGTEFQFNLHLIYIAADDTTCCNDIAKKHYCRPEYQDG